MKYVMGYKIYLQQKTSGTWVKTVYNFIPYRHVLLLYLSPQHVND